MEQILAIFLMIGQIMDISFYYLRLLAIIFLFKWRNSWPFIFNGLFIHHFSV